MAKKSNADIRKEVTANVIKALETGVSPWQRPWVGNPMPHNCASGNRYRGGNVPHLMAVAINEGYATQQWLTFNQARQLGGSVKKGETSTFVMFYKPLTVKDRDTGENRKIFFLKQSRVFNIAQCENVTLPASEVIERPETTGPEHIQAAQSYLNSRGATWREGGAVACYNPALDVIRMPNADAFHTGEGYAATAYHELIHWTGHQSRCNREMSGAFGSSSYAFEELVAELGSAMLCGIRGVSSEIPNHASYIESWLKALKNDDRLIFKAAKLAEAAIDLLEPQTQEIKEAA